MSDRTIDQIQQEYNQNCAEAGHLQYQKAVLSQHIKTINEKLDQVNEKLRRLNEEVDELKKENK